MRLFKRRNTEAVKNDEAEMSTDTRPDPERVPAKLGATCLGEQCPNYDGSLCEDTYRDLHTTKVTEANLSGDDEIPFVDETQFAEYGQLCLRETSDNKLVALHYDIYDPENMNGMEIIAMSGRYGDLPVTITEANGLHEEVSTIARSES